jgi:hypothetical protein
MFGLFGSRKTDPDEDVYSSELPFLADRDGKWDELAHALSGSCRVSDDSRQAPLPDGARGMVYRDGRVAADWTRADGTYSKYASKEAKELRDEAIDRLHQARKWWFGC